MKTLIKFVMLIVIAIMVTILSACTSSNIKVPDTIKYSDVDVELNKIFDNYEIDTERLFIADISTISSYIWIDSSQDEVIEIMLESINVSEKGDSAKVLIYNFQDNKASISKRGDYDLVCDSKHYNDRISIKEYMDFISVFKDTTILDEYNNDEIDYFEIATDGLCRNIMENDFVFNYDCYIFSESGIEALEDKQSVVDDKYYLPVYLSTGKIVEDDGVTRYYNDIVGVVLVERW
jgi:hypothetical protein